MLWVIYAESANYCGYGQHFVVEAQDEAHASELAEYAVEEYFCEQDSDDLVEEYGEDFDDCYGNILSVKPFGPEHEYWKFYQDPGQEEFYTKVNV